MSDHPLLNEFNREPFFPALFEISQMAVSEDIIGPCYFSFDSEAKQYPLTPAPWDADKDTFDSLLRGWQTLEGSLSDLFHNRELQAAQPKMLEGLAIFIEALFWSNEKPVPALSHSILITEAAQLPHKPINIDERLSYILKKPIHYLSYVQLKELFAELKKKHAIAQIKRKK